VTDARFRRGLIVLGFALLLEVCIGFLLRLSSIWNPATRPEPLYLFVPTLAIAPAMFGLFSLASVWNERFIAGAARAGFSAIVALTLGTFIVQFANWGPGSGFFLFYPLSSTATDVGVPLLWASALIRTEHPNDAGLNRIGRVGAGLVQLAFVLQFVALAQSWRSFGYQQPHQTLAGVFYILASTAEIAESVLLLWTSVESVRTASDETVVRDRALRIHRLLKIWVFVWFATSLFYSISFHVSDPTISEVIVDLWRAALETTVPLATTFALARGYLLQFGPTVSPTARSGA